MVMFFLIVSATAEVSHELADYYKQRDNQSDADGCAAYLDSNVLWLLPAHNQVHTCIVIDHCINSLLENPGL